MTSPFFVSNSFLSFGLLIFRKVGSHIEGYFHSKLSNYQKAGSLAVVLKPKLDLRAKIDLKLHWILTILIRFTIFRASKRKQT